MILRTIQKYYFVILVLSVLSLSLISIIAYKTIKYNTEASVQIIKSIEYEYNDIDYEQACRIIGCNKAWFPESNNLYHFENNKFIKSEQDFKLTDVSNIFMLPDSFIYLFNGEMILMHNGVALFLKVNDIIFEVLRDIVIWITLLFVISIFGFYRILQKEERELQLRTSGNEAIMTNKSMIMLTENIHHELNTPLDVIENKIDSLYSHIKRLPMDTICNMCKMREECKGIKQCTRTEDYQFIKTSLGQIHNVLERMRGFKNIKYSNGNKTIKIIAQEAIKMMKIYNSDFTSNVHHNLNDYKLSSKSSLKNADLLNLFINHIKNSIEAGANVVNFKSSFNKNVLTIAIIDNGNGIPKEKINKVFEPNTSTKEIGETHSRGNGMYINREILRASDGDVKVGETSSKGTIIEMKIPAQEIK